MLIGLTIAAMVPSLVSNDLADVEKVAGVCRAATQAQDASGDVGDWLSVLVNVAHDSKLSPQDWNTLIRMCGMYAAGIRDAAQDEVDRRTKELQQNGEELRKLLNH